MKRAAQDQHGSPDNEDDVAKQPRNPDVLMEKLKDEVLRHLESAGYVHEEEKKEEKNELQAGALTSHVVREINMFKDKVDKYLKISKNKKDFQVKEEGVRYFKEEDYDRKVKDFKVKQEGDYQKAELVNKYGGGFGAMGNFKKEDLKSSAVWNHSEIETFKYGVRKHLETARNRACVKKEEIKTEEEEGEKISNELQAEVVIDLKPGFEAGRLNMEIFEDAVAKHLEITENRKDFPEEVTDLTSDNEEDLPDSSTEDQLTAHPDGHQMSVHQHQAVGSGRHSMSPLPHGLQTDVCHASEDTEEEVEGIRISIQDLIESTSDGKKVCFTRI